MSGEDAHGYSIRVDVEGEGAAAGDGSAMLRGERTDSRNLRDREATTRYLMKKEIGRAVILQLKSRYQAEVELRKMPRGHPY